MSSEANAMILCLQRDTTSRISALNISYARKPSSVFHLNTKPIDVNTQVIDYLNQLQDKQFEGKPLSQLLMHKNWGLWQFLPSYLFYHLRLSIEIADRLKNIVETHRPNTIQPCDASSVMDREIWKTCITETCRIYNIHLDNTALHHRPVQKGIEKLKEWGFTLPALMQKRYGLKKHGANLGQKFLQKPAKPGSILFVSSPTYWVPEPGQKTCYDEQMSPVAQTLKQFGETHFTGIDTPYYIHGEKSVAQLKQKIDQDTLIHWGVFDAFENDHVRNTTKHAARQFKQLWHRLKNLPAFHELFNYGEFRLWPILYPHLRNIFLKTLPEIIREIEIAARILDFIQPKAVVFTYEQGPYQRSLILESARRKIPTIALQHGAYVRNCDDLLHTKITADPINEPCGFAVPTLTCVYGPYYQDVLTRTGHYKPENVMVSGHWRYDTFANSHQSQTRDMLRHSFQIPDTSPVVISILTGGLDSMQHINTSLQALKNNPDVTILIKFHPREQTHALMELIDSFALPNCKIIHDRLQDILTLSDLVIMEDTCTTVIEAALFNTPTIIGSYDHRIWDSGFAEAGVCLKVHTVEEMKAAIDKLLHDKCIQEQMANPRPAFIHDRFYLQDGQAAQRVAHKIIELTTALPEPQLAC